MNRRTVLALPALLALPGCLPETHAWHQKLTLVIDTPSGEVTGSSVAAIRVNFYEDPPPLTSTEVEYGVTGEATMVEVVPGRYLFALLGGSEQRFYAATQDRFGRMTRGEWLREIPKQTEPVSLLPGYVPMLVTFDDVTKPETVREVDPADLAAVFGAGVRLKAATLAITEEPVTEGRVKGVLGWLGPYPEPHLVPGDGRSTNIPFGMRVAHGDFIRRKQ